MNQTAPTAKRRGPSSAAHLRTFEERGIKINFDHKFLQSLRLRVPRGPDPRDWEVAMQNYFGTGNKNLAIINWMHIPSFVQLDRRDRDLYDSVLTAGRQRPLDPFAIRTIHLQMDAQYSPDTERRVNAQRELDGEESERVSVQLSFVAHLVRECVLKMGDT